ncbi:complex I NDUFA9 subunit family protein [Candidatus Sumerlaeota bacterium]|nr:complex I NDUFA9 subunit family protein [Candidatus Sumerlaeota bacterium]
MKILLTGGTGFVGTVLREELLNRGHQVRLLVRARSRHKWEHLLGNPQIELIQGDVTELDTMKKASQEVEAIIHLVGIIREGHSTHESFEYIHIRGTETVVEAAQDKGVMRIVFISALGANANARTRYLRSKYQAEQTIKNSGLAFTILRPSIIWGDNDQFSMLLRRFILPFLPMLIPGSGGTRFQPVNVYDLTQGIVKLLPLRAAMNQIFEIGGPEQITFAEIIDRVAEDKGVHTPLKIPVPYFIMAPITALLQGMPLFPLTLEQLKMLKENNVTDDTRFWQITGITPRAYLSDSAGGRR